jgi:hypothetical protein
LLCSFDVSRRCNYSLVDVTIDRTPYPTAEEAQKVVKLEALGNAITTRNLAYRTYALSTATQQLPLSLSLFLSPSNVRAIV